MCNSRVHHPNPQTPLAELQYREYLTPVQAARLFGRGKRFWIQALDTGLVDGFREQHGRYICAESARHYLGFKVWKHFEAQNRTEYCPCST